MGCSLGLIFKENMRSLEPDGWHLVKKRKILLYLILFFLQ